VQTLAYWALALIGGAALFARIQAYPLRHDEQFYIPSGILYTIGGLYPDFGYNQPPNLPILLHLLFRVTGGTHFLLTGRLMMAVAWLISCALIAIVAARESRSRPVAALCVALFVLNPVLLGPAGMAVTNSFLPVTFTLAALTFFLAGARRGGAGGLAFFASGAAAAIAMGLKANYVFLPPVLGLAALAMPVELSFRQRLLRAWLPLVAGGIVGALPSLAYFAADPDGFLAHVTRYHRAAQIDYWAAVQGDDVPAMRLADKLHLARTLWLSGAAGLTLFALLALAALRWVSAGGRSIGDAAGRRAIALMLVLMMLGALISFVPTPAFPQYYVPPLPFAIVAIAILYGQLGGDRLAVARPVLIVVGLVLAVVGAPRLLVALPRLLHPAQWSGFVVHRQAETLARATVGDERPLATLAPLYPLEAGRPIYPQLAGGFVLYRVGDFLHRTEGRHYRQLASPTTLAPLLAARPPSAILVGTEGALDDPFVAFARTHGYRPGSATITDQRNGALTLYLAPVPPSL
jgi:4-amino-4-deoxy-L-arabinose transferase-like glycosyltransferase